EIVAPIVGLGKGHKRPGHGHTGTRRVKKQTRDDELAGANFSSGCREARDAQPAGRASYRARIAELVLVDEAGLESVANRQQGRITCSKFTIFQGARRGPANTPQLNVVKMTIPHPIGLTRRKYAGPHGYPDQRLSEVKSTAVGQLTDVALLAVLVDAQRKRRVQAVKATLRDRAATEECGRSNPRVARVFLDVNPGSLEVAGDDEAFKLVVGRPVEVRQDVVQLDHPHVCARVFWRFCAINSVPCRINRVGDFGS